MPPHGPSHMSSFEGVCLAVRGGEPWILAFPSNADPFDYDYPEDAAEFFGRRSPAGCFAQGIPPASASEMRERLQDGGMPSTACQEYLLVGLIWKLWAGRVRLRSAGDSRLGLLRDSPFFDSAIASRLAERAAEQVAFLSSCVPGSDTMARRLVASLRVAARWDGGLRAAWVAVAVRASRRN